MDLIANGNLLKILRKEKGLTQKEVAERLGVVPKTVSKWETGRGFPDVSILTALADILGVNERSLLVGTIRKNPAETGNLKRTKFYVCPYCGSTLQGLGESQVLCCGKLLSPLQAKQPDAEHSPTISEVENDFYIEFPHEMRKEHFIRFLTYVGCDRILTIRLYPEQDCAVRIPKVYSGKLVYYCEKHGLFEYMIRQKRN